MDQLIINGGNRLNGAVEVSGAKNAALGILAATLLSEGTCVVENIPHVNDIRVLLGAIEDCGAVVKHQNKNKVTIDSSGVNKLVVDYEHVRKIRANYYMLGALLGRFKKAVVPMPGGCSIGSRPIDQHIKGFKALGAEVEIEHGMVHVNAERLIGTNIYLDVESVGATINIMMAAVMAEGQTTIENPAKEPHVVDVANFLNSMGADIKGAGTDVIRIQGVKRLHGCEYMIIPDQIEAGTYMIAAAITGGDVTVKNLIPKHMEAIAAKLIEMNVKVESYADSIRVYADGPLQGVNVKTLPYPGFPTDMQSQMTALLGLSQGNSIMTESIFDNRFSYVDELTRMGANIKVEGNSAVINGVKRYSGAEVAATDLRAGAALVLAGLAAEGETVVSHVEHIDRGYEDMVGKLSHLGGHIVRKSEKVDKSMFRVV